jgi:hypothetical protein
MNRSSIQSRVAGTHKLWVCMMSDGLIGRRASFGLATAARGLQMATARNFFWIGKDGPTVAEPQYVGDFAIPAIWRARGAPPLLFLPPCFSLYTCGRLRRRGLLVWSSPSMLGASGGFVCRPGSLTCRGLCVDMSVLSPGFAASVLVGVTNSVGGQLLCLPGPRNHARILGGVGKHSC